VCSILGKAKFVKYKQRRWHGIKIKKEAFTATARKLLRNGWVFEDFTTLYPGGKYDCRWTIIIGKAC